MQKHIQVGPEGGVTCCVLCSAIVELKARGYVSGGQQVAIVQSGKQPIWRAASTHAIQVSNSTRRFCHCDVFTW